MLTSASVQRAVVVTYNTAPLSRIGTLHAVAVPFMVTTRGHRQWEQPAINAARSSDGNTRRASPMLQLWNAHPLSTGELKTTSHAQSMSVGEHVEASSVWFKHGSCFLLAQCQFRLFERESQWNRRVGTDRAGGDLS